MLLVAALMPLLLLMLSLSSSHLMLRAFTVECQVAMKIEKFIWKFKIESRRVASKRNFQKDNLNKIPLDIFAWLSSIEISSEDKNLNIEKRNKIVLSHFATCVSILYYALFPTLVDLPTSSYSSSWKSSAFIFNVTITTCTHLFNCMRSLYTHSPYNRFYCKNI